MASRLPASSVPSLRKGATRASLSARGPHHVGWTMTTGLPSGPPTQPNSTVRSSGLEAAMSAQLPAERSFDLISHLLYLRVWRRGLNRPRHCPAIGVLILAGATGGSRFAERVAEFQCGAWQREFTMHQCSGVGSIADQAAIFERDAIGIFEIDRLGPAVIDDVGGLYTLGAEFVAFVRERSRRPGLESKMIEARGNAEPAVDPRIVFCGYIGNSVRFQKGDKLAAAHIEKHVPQVAAFFDRYRVGDNRLETQHALVKRAGLVEVEGREPDMRKSLVCHVRCSSDFSL